MSALRAAPEAATPPRLRAATPADAAAAQPSSWLQASVLAFLLSLLLGMAGGRRPRQAREMAQSIASGGGGDVDQMRRLLNDRAALLTNWIAALLAVAVLVLMVWQPAL